MRIAIAQLTCSSNKQANLDKAKRYIEKAKGEKADLVLLPETFMVYPEKGVPYADVAEFLDGPFVAGLAQAAAENRIYVVCGMYEKKAGDGIRAYNTTVVLNSSGELIQSYRKTHLYDAFAYKESQWVIPGDEGLEVFETEFGKVGLLVCYELRFPEICRQLVLQGVDFLLIPTAWMAGLMKEEQFEILIRARAIENTVYICAADQTGSHFAGRSMAVDPMGVIAASAGEEEALLIADMDPDRIRRVREKLPCLQHRRPALYTIK